MSNILQPNFNKKVAISKIQSGLTGRAELNLYSSFFSKFVQSTLHYLGDASAADFDQDHPSECKPTIIFNAREVATPPRLSHEGFCLLLSNIVIRNPYDAASLDAETKKLQLLLREILNTKKILLLGHIIRKEDSKNDQPLVDRAPANFVHADWSPGRIKELSHQHDPYIVTNPSITIKKLADFIENAKCWRIYNVWIPLKTIINYPLALCDVNSVSPADIHGNIYVKNSYSGQQNPSILSLIHKPTYRWLYYPLMQTNELLLFKQFDSTENSCAFIPVFHSAFNVLDNDNIISNYRESIEFRFIVSLK